MKKRILSLLLILVLAITSLPISSFAAEDVSTYTDSTIVVESKAAKAGTTVDVDLLVVNNPGMAGAKITISYDEKLTLIDATSGETFEALDYTRPGVYTSPCNFNWDSENAEVTEDGILLTLTFQVSEDAVVNENLNIELSYRFGDIYNSDLDSLPFDMVSGYVSVIDYTPGDVNDDGVINGKDVTLIRRFNAGGYDVSINEAAADVNDDGVVNGKDVTLVRRFNAGGYDVELLPSTPKCSHTMQATEAKEATCTEDGNDAYWYCTKCEKYFSDADASKEISINDVVIEATGHTEVVDEAVAPTYETTGLTEGSHCSICKAVLIPQDIIPKLKKTEYAITYHIANNDTYLAGIEIINNNPSVYTKEDGLVLQDLIVQGYNFKGWYTSQTGGTKVTDIEVGSTGNKVLYAQWEKVEYTVTFDSPDVPVASVTYTVDKGVTLTSPTWFGYSFVGWSLDGRIVTSIKPGTTGNITLHANWTSNRNRAKAVSSLGTPSIIEDMDNGQYLFVYEIGTIENVPLSLIEYIGNSQGIKIDKEYEYTNSIQEGYADTIAKAVSNATTKTSAWTLSEDWNSVASANDEHSEEIGKTNETTDSTGNVQEGKYYISNVEGGATSSSTNSGGSSGNSSKVTYGSSTGINGSYSKEDSSGSSVELGVDAKISAGVDTKLYKTEVEMSTGFKDTETESHKETSTVAASRDVNVGTEGDEYSESHWDISRSSSSTWNSEQGYEAGASTSKNNTVSNAISQAIYNKYSYSSTEERGGSNSSTHSTDESYELQNEYASTVEFSTEASQTYRKTITYSSDATGYYRLVTAGTVHVFAVVGYDISTNSYYTYTYNVLDKERHEYLDYSKDNANFNDCENAILPFEVPYFVNEFVLAKLARSNGLVIDSETGVIEEYNGNAEYVIIPEYVSVDNGDGTFSAIRVDGISATAFKGNTNIKAVSLPKYVNSIPDSAFEGCTSLETVMGYGIMSIGNKAFSGCTSLRAFTIDKYVTSIGNDAFNGANEISAVAANENVFSAVINSGAKRITLNISELATPIKNTKIDIAKTTDYFALIGNGTNYTNVQIESDAKEIFISNMNFVGNTDTPFKFSSPAVTLSRVTVSGCPGFAMVLTADQTVLNLYGTVELSSMGERAVISKNTTLQKANAEVAGKLKLTGDYLLCGEIINQTLLTFADGELVVIDNSDYDSMLTSSTITFNANGGSLTENTKTVFYGQYYGELPTPTRTGYNFNGWYTAQSGGTKVTADSIVTVLADQTLYAQWTAQSYKVNWNTGTGYTIAVSRSSSPYANASTGALSNGATVYYGDVLSVTYTASTGYTITSKGSAPITVTRNITSADIYAIASVNAYTATWSTGTGYTITVNRTSSPYAGAATGNISSGTTVYYGDVLSVTYTASTGHTIISTGSTSITVTGNVTSSNIYATAIVNSYTASWSAGEGYNITVNRTSSPKAGAATGNIGSGTKVYYGDVLSITYTASTGYTINSKGSTSITVTGNVTSSNIYATATLNSYTYNIVYKSSNGTALGTSTATYKYGTTNTITAPAIAGYNTPIAQTQVWDSTTKTITFTYTPIAVATSQYVWNGWWWRSGTTEYGVCYDVHAEYQNRTANSVQIRLVWKQAINKAQYGFTQQFYASFWHNGTQRANTGDVTIATASLWPQNGSWHTGSTTAYSDWITVSLDTTNATTVVVNCDWWSSADRGSWADKVLSIPAY